MYSEKVMDHFANPRNVGEIADADGVGEVGNLKCGDIMKIYLKVENDIIVDVKFKTFGCGAAVATVCRRRRCTAPCSRRRRCARRSRITISARARTRRPSSAARATASTAMRSTRRAKAKRNKTAAGCFEMKSCNPSEKRPARGSSARRLFCRDRTGRGEGSALSARAESRTHAWERRMGDRLARWERRKEGKQRDEARALFGG